MVAKMDWKKFTHEYRLDAAEAILLSQIINIEAYKEASLNLVLPPDWRDQLDKLNRVRQVHGTTALEGNPLSEAEVSHQIDELDKTNYPAPPPVSENKIIAQVRNAATAQSWVRARFSLGSTPITCGDILEMHRLVTQGSDTDHNRPGTWRRFPVTVGAPDLGGVHQGAPYEQLDRIMQEYVEFINRRELLRHHPVIKALLAHFFLVTIHPFGDGNGRVSRLLEAGILFQQGYNVHGFYGLSNYFYQNERQYKSLLQESRQRQPFDVTPFIKFGVDGFAAELKGINTFIKTKLNRIVYRDMLNKSYNKRIGAYRRLVNEREYNLLVFLLTMTEPDDPFSANPSRQVRFTELRESPYVKGRYKNVTDRTFYRELNRLGELSLITITRDESLKDWVFELNFDAIGRY